MASLMHRSSGIESHPNFLIHCVQLERVQSTAGILLKTLCQKVFTALRSMRAAQQLGKRQSWLMWLIPGFNLSTKLPCNAVRSSCLPYPQNQLSFFCFSDLKFQEIIFPLLKKQTILIWVPQRFLVSCINWTRPKTNHSPKFSCKVISNMNRSMTTCKNYSKSSMKKGHTGGDVGTTLQRFTQHSILLWTRVSHSAEQWLLHSRLKLLVYQPSRFNPSLWPKKGRITNKTNNNIVSSVELLF